MTTFDDEFASRGAPLLMAQYGEKIVYWPVGGAPRTITAIVNRMDPAKVPETPQLVANRASIQVMSDPSHLLYGGISEQEVKVQEGDQVEIALRRGLPSQRISFQGTPVASGGMLTIELP